MSTMPPTPPPEDPGGMGPGLRPGYTAMGNFPWRGCRPGEREFLYVVLALLLVALIALISYTINVGSWMDYFKWISFAYIVSRGLAKARASWRNNAFDRAGVARYAPAHGSNRIFKARPCGIRVGYAPVRQARQVAERGRIVADWSPSSER